ncbi:MAG TPA: hypothetical protein VGN26_16250 [Armatimonadota bacterium]
MAERYPEVPLVALGQTVLWDEPMKAVLWGALQEAGLCARLWFGVLDTDYFAKPPLSPDATGTYAILPHNDGSTKDLWVAMGELSTLFGAETYPSREELAAHGVPVERMAREAPEGRERWIDAVTEAWGWRGLVYTGSRRTLAADVKLADSLEALLELLQWGFGQALLSLADPEAQAQGRARADGLIAHIRSYAAEHPDATLSALFQELLPVILESLLGRPGACTRFGCSQEMFRFNESTAGRPRFEPLDLFLNPRTRDKAKQAYNDAVHGSEIYTLDRFGAGAIPFDLVVPGRGRGTIRIVPGRVIVQADEPLYLRCEREITSAADLAAVVQAQFGTEVSLVGKAVMLIPMICREAVGVFSVTGSGYIWRTRKLVEQLHSDGITLPLYPILRLSYPTWDSLGVLDTTLRLPTHLARAFNQETITGRELSARWRSVVGECKARLHELAALKSPRELLEYLGRASEDGWSDRLTAYREDQAYLGCMRERLEALKGDTQALYGKLRAAKAELQAIDREKGDDFRARVFPIREQLWQAEHASPRDDAAVEHLRAQLRQEELRRGGFEERWESAHARATELKHEIRETRSARRALETAPETVTVRRRLGDTVEAAQKARLVLVRDAILAYRGLEKADRRPSAWWFLLLSPDGTWFHEVQQGTRAFFEPLSAVEPSPAKCCC